MAETSPPLDPANPSVDAASLPRVVAVATLYKRLVLLVGFQIVVAIVRTLSATPRSPEGGPLALTATLVLLGLLVAIAVTTYQLTTQLGERLPIVWAILMFVACFNLIVLLILSSKAQAWCSRQGIKVGLLGPTQRSIDELRRRVQP